MLNLTPLIRQLHVVSKDGDFVNFPIDSPFAWAQRMVVRETERQYNNGLPVRILVLKARQLGISTISSAICFCWVFIHKNSNGLVVAHENETSQSIFEKSQTYWEHGPWHNIYDTERATVKQLKWNNGSALRIATARNLGAGRGRTIQALHTTECAQYVDPQTLMVGLRQTLPKRHGTIEIVESTANGIGDWFHHQWQLAEEGESNYVPLFFPWQKHPEYRMHTTLCTKLELDDEERRLLDLGASYEHLEWRRDTLINDCNNDDDYFRQEYPATPIEAFIASGSNLFDLRALQECYEQTGRYFRGRLFSRHPDGSSPVLVHDPNGPLTIFKKPMEKYADRTDLYFISGDPSRTPTGDPGCMQVINRATYEQVAVWHGHQDPTNFAHEMMMLGHFYNDGMLCPEVEGGGQQVIALLIEHYPNLWQHTLADKAQGKVANTFGFAENWNRKNWCVSAVQYLLGQRVLRLHDPKTVHQMQIYVRTSPYEYGPADNDEHDDAVMALCIGVFCSMTEEPWTDTNLPGNPLVDIYASQGR